MAHLFARGVRDTANLTALEKIRFTWSLYETFGAFEFMFQTNQTGDIPEEVWERWSLIVAWWMTFPGVQEWWQNRPVQFTKSFTSYVEGIIGDNPTDVDANLRWQQFIASGDEE